MFENSSRFLKKARTIILSLLFLFCTNLLLAQSQSNDDVQVADSTKSSTPSLSEIIPLASEISVQYTNLDNEIKILLDQDQASDDFSNLKEELKTPQNKLDRLINNKKLRIDKLIDIKKTVDKQSKTFEDISESLQDAIDELNRRRIKWIDEKQKWEKWEKKILKDGDINELKLTFSQTKSIIDDALEQILPDLEGLLKIQKVGYENKTLIVDLENRLDSLIQDKRNNVFLDASPPLFSADYSAQFTHELWSSLKGGVKNVNWTSKHFFYDLWWVLLIQFIVSIVILVFIYRKEKQIINSDQYSFIAKSPIAVGLFFGLMTSFVFYEFEKIPNSFELAITILGGLSFIRIASVLVKESWKRYFVNGVVILLILIRIFSFINLPIPLYRIFIVVSSLTAVFFSLRISKFLKHKNKNIYFWGLFILAAILSIVIISELLGKEGLSVFLFESIIRFISTILVYVLFLSLVHSGVIWYLKGFMKQSSDVSNDGIQRNINRSLFFVDFFIIVFILLPMSLTIWGVYNSMNEAITEIMTIGIDIGNFNLTIGLIITSISIIYAARLISILSQKIFMSRIFDRRKVEEGARHSINRLINYFIMSIGFLIALSAFGFEITKVTIVLSALGIGIGFGLQGIVNNFVSGLILLFDRPVREGDQIQIGEMWSTIKKIGLRATRVETSDEADLIVPNADLVYNQVTNWTLSNRHIRIKVDVGVAYGSDVTLVIETLLAAAKANKRLVQNHSPQVLFLGFGDSSLNFELRVWGREAGDRMVTHSELNQDIDKRFREANIEIAFPQQDLHLRSIDKSISFKSKVPFDKNEGK